MRRIDTAAADFAIAVVADCFITRYGQIFELNACTVDCEAAAILRISAAGNRTVFHGNLRFITGNGYNSRLCVTITRQRKPAEVERQRLVNLDIFRNITEHDDGDIAVCIINVCRSNRFSNSRILVLADPCSVYRRFRFSLLGAGALALGLNLGRLTLTLLLTCLTCRIFRSLR